MHPFLGDQVAQGVEHRAVGIDAGAARGAGEVVRPPPALEQILERLAQHAFTAAARYGAQPVELGAVFVDQLLRHLRPPGRGLVR